MTIEKNDVEVSKLFEWSKTFEVVDNEGEISDIVYMRLLGDADLNRARVHALRKSTELRRKLRDENSDEYMAYIRDKAELEKETLIKMIILFNTREITKRATDSIEIVYPKMPKSDATTEAQEKYQEEVDAWPVKRRAKIKKALEKEVSKMEEALKEESEDELYKKYVFSLTDEMCEQQVLNSFKEISTYLGVYKDAICTERYFNSLEDFMNLSTGMKADFMSAYSTLEVDMGELKKLRVATQ